MNSRTSLFGRMTAAAAIACLGAVLSLAAGSALFDRPVHASGELAGILQTPGDNVPPPPDEEPGDLIDMENFGDLAELEAADDPEDLAILAELDLYGALDDQELDLFSAPANEDLFDEIASLDDDLIVADGVITDVASAQDSACQTKVRELRKKARAELRQARRTLLGATREKNQQCETSARILGVQFPVNQVNDVDACLDGYRTAKTEYRHATDTIRDAYRKKYRDARRACRTSCRDDIRNCRKAARNVRNACRKAARKAHDLAGSGARDARAVCRKEGPQSPACIDAMRLVHLTYRKAARQSARECRAERRKAHRVCVKAD